MLTSPISLFFRKSAYSLIVVLAVAACAPLKPAYELAHNIDDRFVMKITHDMNELIANENIDDKTKEQQVETLFTDAHTRINESPVFSSFMNAEEFDDRIGN